MAKPFPPTKPLADMTKDELFELAVEHQIPGRHDMKKADLLVAVEEALTAPDAEPAPEGDSESDGTEPLGADGTEEGDNESDEQQDELNDEGEGSDEPSEPSTNPDNPKPSQPAAEDADAAAGRAELEAELHKDAAARETREREAESLRLQEAELQRRAADAKRAELAQKAAADRAAAHAVGQLTEDDRRDLMRASPRDLDDLLSDDSVPEFVKVGVRVEQERRKRQATLDTASKMMKSPNTQFKITGGPAGMRYVTPTAYVTTLPIGSVVTPLAYDLKHVAEQGFTWEQIKGVELSEDQLGNQVSTAK